eukprot:4720584-Pleurochrysis_carterae.AAC.1
MLKRGAPQSRGRSRRSGASGCCFPRSAAASGSLVRVVLELVRVLWVPRTVLPQRRSRVTRRAWEQCVGMGVRARGRLAAYARA